MYLADAMHRRHHDADRLATELPPVTVLGIDRVFIPQDKPDRILAHFGLDADGLVRSVREAIGAPVHPRADTPD